MLARRLEMLRPEGRRSGGLARKGVAMDFIERWFSVSPDGGDGSLEAALSAVTLGIVLAVVLRHQLWAFLRRMSRRIRTELPR
jgi:hypothetical protein